MIQQLKKAQKKSNKQFFNITGLPIVIFGNPFFIFPLTHHYFYVDNKV